MDLARHDLDKLAHAALAAFDFDFKRGKKKQKQKERPGRLSSIMATLKLAVPGKSSKKCSASPPPTLLALNDNRLPAEILSQIVSEITQDFVFSNDPQHNSEIRTVLALLRTSRLLRSETEKQLYRHPLRIYVNERKMTDCGLTEDWCAECIAAFARKMMGLPLGKWPSLEVVFAPTVHKRIVDARVAKIKSEFEGEGEESSADRSLAVRVEFRKAIRATYHNSVSLAGCLKFLQYWGCCPRAKIDDRDIKVKGLRMSHVRKRRQLMAARGGVDKALKHCRDWVLGHRFEHWHIPTSKLPFNFDFTFESCPEACTAPEQQDLLPVWNLRWVCQLLSPWIPKVIKRPLLKQVRLPALMSVCAETRDISAFPPYQHRSDRLAIYFQHDLEEHWIKENAFGPSSGRFIGAAWRYRNTRDWYLASAPYRAAPALLRRGDLTVLRISTVEPGGRWRAKYLVVGQQ